MAPPEREPSLRLFVACELPSDVRAALEAIQRELRARGGEKLRYVRPEGIHVTLKFLGEVPRSRVAPIQEALATAVPTPAGLRLRPAALGAFGGRQRLRVIWIGLEGDTQKLAELASRVEGALEGLGFPRERRPFAAHLTLARVRDSATPDERARLAQAVEGYALPDMPEFIVERVSLMQSTLGPGGAIYRRLAAFPPEAGP
jgi:2'-5' RNA ligase